MAARSGRLVPVAGTLAVLALCGCGGGGGGGNGIWHVDSAAPDGGDGKSWWRAFRHPQDAVDVAQADDEVWVARGTYARRQETDSVVLTMKDGVAIYGGFAGTETRRSQRDHSANVTILDGDADGDGTGDVYHVVIGASASTLDGFTVTNGNASGIIEPDDQGGGMYNDSLTDLRVANCVFSSNVADDEGGGIYNDSVANMTIASTRFTTNFAGYCGGGICNFGPSSPAVTECSFAGNAAGLLGGGIYSGFSSLEVSGCTFSGNEAMHGGAIYVTNFSSPLLQNCWFTGNSASRDGGGIHNFSHASPKVTNCMFAGNSAVEGGGGMFNRAYSSPEVVNCTFSGNSASYGGGVCNEGQALPGAGSFPEVVNCILWGDSATTGGPEIYDDADSSTALTYSCIGQAGYAGSGGNIGDDPLLVGPHWDDNGTPDDPFDDIWIEEDYHLQSDSPCVDAGDPSTTLDRDIEGNPRPIGSGYDMGAYEFQDGVHDDGEPSGLVDGAGCAAGNRSPGILVLCGFLAGLAFWAGRSRRQSAEAEV